jgi:hypothetical protein
MFMSNTIVQTQCDSGMIRRCQGFNTVLCCYERTIVELPVLMERLLAVSRKNAESEEAAHLL